LTIIIIVKRGEEKGFSPSTVPCTQPSAWALAQSKALSDLDAVLKRCAQASMLHNQVIIQLHLQSITTPSRYPQDIRIPLSELLNQFLPFFSSNPYHLIAHRKANAKGF